MAQYHIEGFRQAGAEIVAVADLNEEAAKATAEEYGVGQTFGSVEAMFDALPVSMPYPSSFPTNFTPIWQYKRLTRVSMCSARSLLASTRTKFSR